MTEISIKQLQRKGWGETVSFDKFDPEQGLLRARYLFCGQPPEEKFSCNGHTLPPAYAKNRLVFQKEGQQENWSVFERILWLPIMPSTTFETTVENGVLNLQIGGRETFPNECTPAAVARAFSPIPPDDQALPPETRALRRLAQSPAMREIFEDAWMFMDRDTRADDNAEHLYRWIRQHHPEINTWFVLHEESLDWSRLRAEGFRLIPFGSLKHKALFLLARNLISSQNASYVHSFLENQYYADLRRCKHICLKHGVISADHSRVLNALDVDLFLPTTDKEYHSLVDDGTSYVLTAKEVVLTGQARHDSLREITCAGKNIFIMPTWRQNIVGARNRVEHRREYNPAFIASPFAQIWRNLLVSHELKRLCRKYSYELIFWPHSEFANYLAEFRLPDHIRTPGGESLQVLLKQSALLITDYSSIAFDMALLRRPMLYYHFESYDHFLKAQGRKDSYFRYDRDGFGQVCGSQEELLAALERTLAAGCRVEAPYLERMEQTLHLNDGKCCERIFEAIRGLRP